jgi:hypothetical protein
MAVAQEGWSFVILHPPGAQRSWVNAMTDTQQAGAFAAPGGEVHACIWSGTPESMVDLHPAAAMHSEAYDTIGTMQCGVANISGGGRASLWHSTPESWVSLHPPGAGGGATVAHALTETHQVGNWTEGALFRAVLWSGTPESMVNLHPAGAWTQSLAWAVAGNQQAGWVSNTIGPQYAAIWYGTPESRVDVTPPGAMGAQIWDTTGTQQAGWTQFPDYTKHACIWSGTPESWIDLNPSGALGSHCLATTGTYQAGWARWGGELELEACIWSGTPESHMNLHALLPPQFLRSEATDICESGGMLYVAGSAWESLNHNYERAILWIGPAPAPPCPADVTGDGTVDVLDLLYVLAQWGMSGVPSDINGDGVVNVLDMLEVLAAWGPCP